MHEIMKLSILAGVCVLQGLFLVQSALGAGAVPPDISTLAYSEKAIEMTKATYSITVPAGEFWDVSSVTAGTGVTPSRLNIRPAEGAMVRFAPGSLSALSDTDIEFGSAGWILIDASAFPVYPKFYGGNILVTNNVTCDIYLAGTIGTPDNHKSNTICVRDGCKFELAAGGGIRFSGNWITKTGAGTLALSGSKKDSAVSMSDPTGNSGHLIAEEGVIDFTGMKSSSYFCCNLSSNWTSTVEIYDDAVVKFGSQMPDVHNLIMRGGRIESTQAASTTGNSMIICDSISVLPNATPSVIDVPTVGLTQILGHTNVVTVAEGATLKIQGRLKRSSATLSTGVLRKSGTGTLEVAAAEDDVTVLLPDLLSEAAVWIDATDLQGYATGEHVNAITNRGTAGGVFRNFVKSSTICAEEGYLANKNGQLPGPEYQSAGINDLPALRFCLTNALYTTAYRNVGGKEMTVFCVTAYLSTDCINCGTNLTFSPSSDYGLIDMTYSGSDLNNKIGIRLIMQDRAGYFGKGDKLQVAQFSGGSRTQPRVLVASRRDAAASFAMYGTDAQGVATASKAEMTNNLSNRVDIIMLGGCLQQTLKKGPYCHWGVKGPDGKEKYDDIDYTYNQRMASGVLGEYIVFDRKLTSQEEDYVATYLRRKWLGSAATAPRLETASTLTLSAAANTTNTFAASVFNGNAKAYGVDVGVRTIPTVVKTGAGTVAVTGLSTVPTALHVAGGELDLSAGVDPVTSIVAEDGTRLASARVSSITLDSLTVGDNATFVRPTVSREPTAYKMFDVTGPLALGVNPAIEIACRPKGDAEFLSYGSLTAADPLAWTVRNAGRGFCEVEDDRESKVFRLVPLGGSVLIIR